MLFRSVNYIYGTFLALRGLQWTRAQGVSEAVRKAAEFLRLVQNADGGWGESCTGYRTNRFVPARSTPSQTAWARLGLAAAGEMDSSIVQRGLDWLLNQQREDGQWDEDLMTGTGFPNVFYLTYHMYRDYFPLLALAVFSSKQFYPAIIDNSN